MKMLDGRLHHPSSRALHAVHKSSSKYASGWHVAVSERAFGQRLEKVTHMRACLPQQEWQCPSGSPQEEEDATSLVLVPAPAHMLMLKPVG